MRSSLASGWPIRCRVEKCHIAAFLHLCDISHTCCCRAWCGRCRGYHWGSLAWGTEASCALREVPSWEAGAAAKGAAISAPLLTFLDALLSAALLFPTLASPSPLNCMGQMKISTQQFFSPLFPPILSTIRICSRRNMCCLRDVRGCERVR